MGQDTQVQLQMRGEERRDSHTCPWRFNYVERDVVSCEMREGLAVQCHPGILLKVLLKVAAFAESFAESCVTSGNFAESFAESCRTEGNFAESCC